MSVFYGPLAQCGLDMQLLHTGDESGMYMALRSVLQSWCLDSSMEKLWQNVCSSWWITFYICTQWRMGSTQMGFNLSLLVVDFDIDGDVGVSKQLLVWTNHVLYSGDKHISDLCIYSLVILFRHCSYPELSSFGNKLVINDIAFTVWPSPDFNGW